MEVIFLDNIPNDYFRFIPAPVFSKGKILGIQYINWIEAVAFSALLGRGIFATDLVIKIKVICCCVLCTSMFALCLHGIKNRSILTFIYDIMKDNSRHIKYSLGSVNNERRRKKPTAEGQFGNMSLFERVMFSIKRKAKAIDDRYDKK